ncbi:Short-chain dehydrogenase [Nocardia amikacinitolerans]|uniref:SDR family NAD(P)-dependent oxidoreductase n=1 Tax=Nocardia amikacinitolerans TaxID=756689 RepID=UPI00082F071F|nr:SDR family NAD(P)-dependent oxidoreductase [Nocardia amikacinitolerans]MCP2317918.1 Short-chain dehydrogenase [Nocardia amikacinitolerans]
MKIEGSRVLITGATGGIGHAIAHAFAERGAELVLTGRRVAVLAPLAEQTGARAVPADLADRDGVAALLAAAGPLDIVVANAAVPASGLLTDYSIEQIDRALDVNLRAPIVTARLLAEPLIAKGHGHLVFISSISGKIASPRVSLYNATKFGLRGFAQALRQDLAPHGVGVSTVFPGFVRDAGMFADAGVPAAPGTGTSSPAQVAAAVRRAVERNVGEIDVAPPQVRLGALLAGIAPGLSARVQRLAGADKIAATLAEAQRAKR